MGGLLQRFQVERLEILALRTSIVSFSIPSAMGPSAPANQEASSTVFRAAPDVRLDRMFVFQSHFLSIADPQLGETCDATRTCRTTPHSTCSCVNAKCTCECLTASGYQRNAQGTSCIRPSQLDCCFSFSKLNMLDPHRTRDMKTPFKILCIDTF